MLSRQRVRLRRLVPQVESLEDRAVPSTAPVLQDNFDDNVLDVNRWAVDPSINPGLLPVRERNQRIEFYGPGSLITRSEFQPTAVAPLEIDATFTWSPSPELVGPAQIVTRSNADLVTPQGVEFTIDPASQALRITAWNNGVPEVLVEGRVRIDPGDSFRVGVHDDGQHVSIGVVELSGNGVAMGVSAETGVNFSRNQVVFRSGGVSFGPVARLALDDVAIGPPAPPTPPVSPPATPLRPILVLIGGDLTDDTDGSPGRGVDVTGRVRIQRGKVRLDSRRGKVRMRFTIRNTSGQELSSLRLALAQLPARTRVRVADGTWMTASQVASSGASIGDHDDLKPGESVTLDVEIVGPGVSRPRMMPRLLSTLDPNDNGPGGSPAVLPGVLPARRHR